MLQPCLFTPNDRDTLRANLLTRAEEDPRIVAAAVTGSAAGGTEDRWSDIDLAFGVREGVELAEVLTTWTALLYDSHGAVHHMDVMAGPWIYRVFFLANTLQVDLAFVPATEFRALAPTFRLVFGASREAQHLPGPEAVGLVGFGWLYALHARSSLARGKWWQAEYMIRGVRDQAMALACLRQSLPAVHGKGFDLLPAGELMEFAGALPTRLEEEELRRAFEVATGCLMREIRLADAELARRLEEPLARLAEHPA